MLSSAPTSVLSWSKELRFSIVLAFASLEGEAMADLDLPERLRALRQELGVTQDQLAHALNVSEPLISSWEKSTIRPEGRLRQCATIFATYRVDSAGRLRPLPEEDLTTTSRAAETALRDELDSLLELYGYLRATNPRSTIRYRLAPDLTDDDYKTDLALLGGVDFNAATELLLERINPPVSQIGFYRNESEAAFVERRGGRIVQRFTPSLRGEKGPLVWDVAQLIRGRNPFNQQRTFTICNGMYGRGVLGAVRALTDETFRHRNTGFVRETFPAGSTFSVLFKVEPYEDTVHTPDWTQKGTVLHTWSDPG